MSVRRPGATQAIGRDLRDACRASLERSGPATARDVARRVRARDAEVRRVLDADPLVIAVPPPAGRKHNARCYALAGAPGAGVGTSRDRQNTVNEGEAQPKGDLQLELPLWPSAAIGESTGLGASSLTNGRS